MNRKNRFASQSLLVIVFVLVLPMTPAAQSLTGTEYPTLLQSANEAVTTSEAQPEPAVQSGRESGSSSQDDDLRELSPFRAGVVSGGILPLGAQSSFVAIGLLVAGSFTYMPEFLPGATVGAEIGYVANRYNNATLLSVPFFNLNAGYALSLSDRLSLTAHAGGGYMMFFLTQAGIPQSGGGLSVRAGAGIRISLLRRLDLFLSADYRMLQGAYSGVSVSLGSSARFLKKQSPPDMYGPGFRPGTEPIEGKLIELETVELTRVFPVFYSYYDDHPVGAVRIRNTDDKQLQEVKVSLLVNEYMEAPKTCATFELLEPGAEHEVELLGLFVDRVLEITEGKKVAAEITVEYKKDDQRYRDRHVQTLEMAYRNAMTWDDDRKAAAFVTARDPHVRAFAGNVGSIVKEAEYTINPNLSKAIAYFEAIRLHGMNYQRDPSTPYEEMSANALMVDSLQFPRETLDYRAGDCDDLSILFAALLESVFVPTAFITIPGHIYLALSLGIPPSEAHATFSRPEDLIFIDNQT